MRIAVFCIMTERTKHTHAQSAFRFLAERHKTLTNGTLAEGLVGETTRSPMLLFEQILLWLGKVTKT